MAKRKIVQLSFVGSLRNFISGRGTDDADRRETVRSMASDALACGDITPAEYEQVVVTGEAPWVTEEKNQKRT